LPHNVCSTGSGPELVLSWRLDHSPGLEALAKRYDQPALKSSTGGQTPGQIKRGQNHINAELRIFSSDQSLSTCPKTVLGPPASHKSPGVVENSEQF